MERYNFLAVEKKWREDKFANKVKNTKADKKFYCLEMFTVSTVGPVSLERL